MKGVPLEKQHRNYAKSFGETQYVELASSQRRLWWPGFGGAR